MSEYNHISLYVNIASKQIRRNMDAIFMKYGNLTGIQARILGELAQAEYLKRNLYQKDLEQLFGIRRSSVSSVISLMEQNGYLIRVSTKEDARLKKLVFTEKGRQTSQAIYKELEAYEQTLDSNYSAEERQLFISLLKRLTPDCTCSCHGFPPPPEVMTGDEYRQD